MSLPPAPWPVYSANWRTSGQRPLKTTLTYHQKILRLPPLSSNSFLFPPLPFLPFLPFLSSPLLSLAPYFFSSKKRQAHFNPLSYSSSPPLSPPAPPPSLLSSFLIYSNCSHPPHLPPPSSPCFSSSLPSPLTSYLSSLPLLLSLIPHSPPPSQYYRVILLVPDMIDRLALKELMNLLLLRMEFAAAFLHQASQQVFYLRSSQ